MLIAVLLLQVPGLLPPAPPAGIAPDPEYALSFQDLLAAGRLDLEQVDALRPSSPAQVQVLVEALTVGSPVEVRAAALLSAGATADSPLAMAALHGVWNTRDEGAALAALLAPLAFPAAGWPALAWISLDPERPIAVRATATGRLLRSGCRGAWPVARSLLRTGTAFDEQAPWADWNRLGRYELPKRLLVLDLDAWFAEVGEAGSGFEPNAAWQVQVEQLQALEPRIQGLLARTAPLRDEGLATGVAALLRYQGPSEERACRAAALLVPHASATLQLALTKRDAALVYAARRSLELIPR